MQRVQENIDTLSAKIVTQPIHPSIFVSSPCHWKWTQSCREILHYILTELKCSTGWSMGSLQEKRSGELIQHGKASVNSVCSPSWKTKEERNAVCLSISDQTNIHRQVSLDSRESDIYSFPCVLWCAVFYSRLYVSVHHQGILWSRCL